MDKAELANGGDPDPARPNDDQEMEWDARIRRLIRQGRLREAEVPTERLARHIGSVIMVLTLLIGPYCVAFLILPRVFPVWWIIADEPNLQIGVVAVAGLVWAAMYWILQRLDRSSRRGSRWRESGE